MHPALLPVFGAFDSAGARWCILRGDLELLDPTGDIDVLVARRDVRALRPVLAHLGFHEIPGRGYGTHRCFLGHHPGSCRWVKLDVMTELAFGADFGLSTGAESECLSRRRRIGPAAVLDEDDAFWTLLLHCLLDDRPLRGDRARQLGELAGAVGGRSRLACSVDSACPPGWSAAWLVELVQAGQWQRLAGFAPELEAGWRRRQRLTGASHRALVRVRRDRDRVRRRLSLVTAS